MCAILLLYIFCSVFMNIHKGALNGMSSQLASGSSLGLYRYLLRRLHFLPKDAYHYYKHRIRQVYKSRQKKTYCDASVLQSCP